MTLKTVNFEAGPQDAAVTTTTEPNLSLASPGTGGSITFDAAMAGVGSFGAKFTGGASAGCLARVAMAASSDVLAVSAVYTAASTTPGANITILGPRDTAGAATWSIRHSTANSLQVIDAGGTTLGTLVTGVTAGTKYRITLNANRATGALTVKVYQGLTTTVLGSYSGASGLNLGTVSYGFVQFGFSQTFSGGVVGFDVVSVDDGSAAEIGPPTANNAPTANAGASQYVATGQSLTLTGTATDADGTIVSRAWTCVEYPGSSAPTITNSASASATVTPVDAGRYRFRFTVTDNGGLTGFSEVTEYVYPPSNVAAKVYSVTPGAWANTGGAATLVAALNDGSAATYALSPSNPAGAVISAVLCPLGPGDLAFQVSGYAETGTVTRVCRLYKEDGTSLVYQQSWTLPAAEATQTVTVDSQGLSLLPGLADRRALVVTITDTAS